MSTFSQRNGYTPLPLKMKPESITTELRNTLWNFINEAIKWQVYDKVTELLWLKQYKLPVDSRPCQIGYNSISYEKSWAEVRGRILGGKWYEVYDHVEFFAHYSKETIPIFNGILEQEFSAYRIIQGKVCPITDGNELESVESAMAHVDRFAPVANHIKTAVQLMSDRNQPDYRNSIKESISAVESAGKILMCNQNAELGKILGLLEAKGKINGALKKGFGAIYGWTCDQHGIRHGMTDEPNISQADAKLFLIMCSAFTNYLKTVDLNLD
jgi:hypothetical protein